MPISYFAPLYKDCISFNFFVISIQGLSVHREFLLYIGDDASPERLDKIVESYQNKVNLVYHRFSENMGGQRFGGPLGEVYPAVCRAVYLAFLG